MQKITPCLWFEGNAEEAVAHYLSIFRDAKILSTTPGPGGNPLVIQFQLEGLQFLALNGGPYAKFNEAISLSVDCDTQEEVDRLWARLCDGGQPSHCGWLKDKFGVSWQIVPRALVDYMQGPDRARAGRVLEAMMTMGCIDIARLHAAAQAA